MNNQSPLVPQGSLLEQKNRGRVRVKIAVFFVLAIHGIGLLALLMQGCRRASETKQEETNAPPQAMEAVTNVVADTNGPAPPAPTPPTEPPSPPGAAATEYVVVANDTYSTIAPRFHVTVKALMDANPGVEPTRLRPGQKLHIPPPAPSPAPGSNGTTPGASAGGEEIYTVKSGDTLSTIANHYHTTVKAIRAANGLTTDRIIVGQKLKMPKPAVPAEPTPAPK